MIKNHLSLILTLIAVGLIAVGGIMAEYTVSDYGLIGGFPVLYFAGLGLLAVAFVLTLIHNRHEWKLLLFQTGILITALWFIPATVGSHPGLPMAYRNLFDVNEIAEKGWTSLIDGKSAYLSWLGFQVVCASITKIFSLNWETVLWIYPFIMQVLYLIPLYVFLRNTAGKTNYVWLGLWVFSLANWIGQEYFCPQSAGILLVLAFLALITLKPDRRNTRIAVNVSLAGIVGITVVTHLLSSLVMVLFLLVYSVMQKNKKVVLAVVMCLALVAAWNWTAGGYYMQSMITLDSLPKQALQEGMVDMSRTETGEGLVTLDAGYILESNVLGSLSGSDAHRKVTMFRIGYSAMFALAGLVLAVYILWKRRTRQNVMLLLMVGSLCCLLPIRAAGWELSQRLYLFALPFLSYYCVIFMSRNKRWVLPICITIIACMPLWFITHYGNQVVDHLSEDYIEGMKQVEEIKNTAKVPVFLKWGHVGWLDEQLVFSDEAAWGIHYFAVSTHDVVRYTFAYNEPDFVDNVSRWIQDSESQKELLCEYEVFWENPGFVVYSGYRALDEEMWEKWGDWKWKYYR